MNLGCSREDLADVPGEVDVGAEEENFVELGEDDGRQAQLVAVHGPRYRFSYTSAENTHLTQIIEVQRLTIELKHGNLRIFCKHVHIVK